MFNITRLGLLVALVSACSGTAYSEDHLESELGTVLQVPAVPTYIEGSWQETQRGLHEQPLLVHTGGNDTAFFLVTPTAAGQALTDLSVLCEGGTGHDALPTTPPRVDVIRVVESLGADYFGAPEVLAAAADPSASVAEYEAVHEIRLEGLYVSLDQPGAVYVRLFGEVGSGSIPREFKVSSISLTLQ